MIETLTRFEWVQQPEPGVRMKFRKDGTGFYEREGAPGTRLVRDNLLYRFEGSTLHLKFAHARLWTQVEAEFKETGLEARFGRWRLTLDQDPYAATVEGHQPSTLALWSDSGAALLG